MARQLLIIADDFGIGPETSRGILELAERGVVTGSVLLANSPFAEDAVAAWRRAGQPMDLGWHPNLTLDRPILDAARIPTLVGSDGCFLPLSTFLARLYRGAIHPDHIRAELEAQYERFCQLTGAAPSLVNAHHHLHIFSPIGDTLLDILGRRKVLPYVRRVREAWASLWRMSGARAKRLLLSSMGRRQAEMQARRGFPGNDWMIGAKHLHGSRDGGSLESVPGQIVELVCHPGHRDRTLVGRDDLLQQREDEWRLLQVSTLPDAIARQGWQLTAPRHALAKARG